MEYIRNISLAAVLILIAGAASAYAQEVSASIAAPNLKRGTTVKGEIVLTIPEGYHVNSNSPSSEFAIPTTAVVTSPGLAISGPTFPAGEDQKFAFSEDPINVYEGRVVFPFEVKVPRRAKLSDIEIKIKVRYQACTNEVCYPPRNKEVLLKASIVR